ncbi:MAG: DUF6329 domain-containing protein [[Clostridium] symbiosum]
MIRAVFERKPDFRLWDVVIETVIRLPKEEYEQFLSSPCDSYEFIEKNSKSMLMNEKNGVFYCMLVTGEGYRDGVLVEAEGYPYARYASYVPDATALVMIPFKGKWDSGQSGERVGKGRTCYHWQLDDRPLQGRNIVGRRAVGESSFVEAVAGYVERTARGSPG